MADSRYFILPSTFEGLVDLFGPCCANETNVGHCASAGIYGANESISGKNREISY
jgi:hypothetical protein